MFQRGEWLCQKSRMATAACGARPRPVSIARRYVRTHAMGAVGAVEQEQHSRACVCRRHDEPQMDAAAKPFRQLPRRYNFISLLCNFLINPANSSSNYLDRMNPACSLRLPYHLLHSSRTALGLLGQVRSTLRSHAHASFFKPCHCFETA